MAAKTRKTPSAQARQLPTQPLETKPPASNDDVALLCGAATFAAVGQLSMTEGFRKLTVSEGGAFQVMTPVLITLASVAVFAVSLALTAWLGWMLW